VLAQQAEVTRYDVGQGLPQSMVNHVLQDAEGFMWFGTGDGLARFDGQRFVVYKHDARDSSTLGHNSIWGLAQRTDGQLWVGTRSGLDRLDRRTGRFEHIATGLPPEADGCWQPVWDTADSALFYSPLGSIFLSVHAASFSTRSVGHIASYAMHADARTGTVTQALYGDTLLTLTRDGAMHVALLPARGGERTLALLHLGPRWLVLTDLGGYTWSPTEGRRALASRTEELFTRMPGNKRVCTDAQGHLWVGLSGTGVVQLDTALNVLAQYPLLPPDERPLTITAVVADRQGNIWVGTDGKGVFRIAPQRVRFGRCMPGQGLAWEPPSWFVRSFTQWDAHRVLVSFYQGGQALFDERSGELSRLVLPAPTAAAFEGYDLKNWFTDRHGLVWCQDLLQVFALERGSARLLFQEHAPRGAALTRSPEGDAVILTHHAVRRMQWNGRDMVAEPVDATRVLHRIDSMGVMPSKFALDEQGTLVLCQSILPITVWRDDVEIPVGPFPDDVRMTSFGPRSGNHVWMTSNNGLYRADQRTLKVNGHWTVHDGLPDQYLYGMLPAGDGAWWISSNKGLSHFDERTERFTNYGVRDGLQSTEFNTQAFFRSTSGRLYFGGVNGFNHFMPGPLMEDRDTALVALVGLAVQDRELDLSVGEGPRTVVLPYGRNHLRVDLAVLEFSAPEANRYRYRVTGYTDWTEHPADRPITLTNMPDGAYRLEVIGINGDGLASDPRELLHIRVPLPFRNSPWAYVLAGALIIAALGSLVFLWYRHRVRLRQERTEVEMKELRIRTRIAQDLHDDLGSGLARITALSRTAVRGVNKGEDVRAPVEKMTALSQELMHDLRDVVWVNDPHGGDLADLLLRIRDHVQDLFEGTHTTCATHFPAPLPEQSIGPAAKRNIYLIAKEAAHNAWKYSAANNVTVVFHLDAGHFLLELSDDGKGLPEGAESKGHGLRNMNARAAEFGCTLRAENRLEGGYAVVLAGPLSALDL
jgi:signal transduction histidine kinase/ligand-binding sensor domain-containing protein